MAQLPKTWIQYDKTLPYIEDRQPHQKPTAHLIKAGENSYKVIDGRRPSKMLLVNKLREEVGKWRDGGYPGVSNTTRILLSFWFEEDHLVKGEKFRFWFCQREAIETLIYLFEVKKFKDLKPVLETYAENFRRGLLLNAVELVETPQEKRKVIRYFPELEQEGEQEIPEENLLRYAFKMATGSGKTVVMAMVLVWSYFHRKKENNSNLSDNFLILAPNVIVYERLKKDFADNKIFYELPLIPAYWLSEWNLKITLREDSSPLNPSGNLIVNNIQQLYESREEKWTPENIVDEILGKKPQKDLTKSPVTLLEQIKKLDNLIALNDEAHHVHRVDLKWHETLMSIHNSLPDGLTLWLDYSATPKTQTGTYYPWIIVDYPLAQAVEDRIVKAPLIVHRVDKKDPEDISSDNVVQKYGDWITAALTRWGEHYEVYQQVGKKPVLFIMAEKNEFADRLADAIRKDKKLGLKEDEVLVIHTDNTGEVRKSQLEDLRKRARDIDEPQNEVKVIVSVMMLREGWDVQNVTVVLGLRPFTAKAEILPEQAVGRGLRIIKGISPDHTQTLEVMGTEAFEEFVKELEKEGVGINAVKDPPPLPPTIASEKSRLIYDIEVPLTGFRYSHNYKNIEKIEPLKIPSIYSSDKLEEERKILLKMDFSITETEVHQVELKPEYISTSQEYISHITNEVMKRARFTSSFSDIYPKIEKYITEKCFETKIKIEDGKLAIQLSDMVVREAIIDLLAKEFSKITTEEKGQISISESFKLSENSPFVWRRKRERFKKTVFNFVAVYNDFEVEFANFLDKCDDIEKFASLAGTPFRTDYIKSSGAIGLYYPDFVAVQKINKEKIFCIIETKGMEYEDTDKKDAAMGKWCKNIGEHVKQKWCYLKVPQSKFNLVKGQLSYFEELVKNINVQNYI